MIVMMVIPRQKKAKLHFNDDGAVYGDDDGDDYADFDGYSKVQKKQKCTSEYGQHLVSHLDQLR